MRCGVILITEGYSDKDIIRAILNRRFSEFWFGWLLPPGKPNLSQLARHLPELIDRAKGVQQSQRANGIEASILVLHDEDRLSRPHGREDYDKIENICRKHQGLLHVTAKDELESWLLADSGICSYLGVKPSNHDEQERPSVWLANLLDRAGKPKYRLNNLENCSESILQPMGISLVRRCGCSWKRCKACLVVQPKDARDAFARAKGAFPCDAA